jgi:chromosome partitioning protein
VTIWTVANQKGGVGKTTTAVTLAGLCAGRGQRVLLLDLDPHGSLTSYFGYDPETLETGIYSLFQSETLTSEAVLEVMRETSEANLQLLPASTALATLDRQLGARGGMGLVIGRALAAVRERFDHVLIDCPPMLGVLMVNALAACDRLIIPVQTEFLALKGLERMLHTLAMIERARSLQVAYTIVPTMFDRRTRASVDSLRALRERFAAHLWGDLIPVDTRFREASRAGRPLGQIWPDSRGAQAYGRLLEYLHDDHDRHEQAVAS